MTEPRATDRGLLPAPTARAGEGIKTEAAPPDTPYDTRYRTAGLLRLSAP